MIGRNKEITILNRLYDSKKSQFVAIYGRRRVGKTCPIAKSEVGHGEVKL